MKRQIIKALIGLSIGIILVIIFKKWSPDGTKIYDFIPLIGLVIYYSYQNYQVIKRERTIIKKKIEAINNNRVFAYDNILISKNGTDDNIIKVRNDLFWFDLRQKTSTNENDLIDGLISDFKKLSNENDSFRNIMANKTIEFSLIDNVNYDDKILITRSLEFNKI